VKREGENVKSRTLREEVRIVRLMDSAERRFWGKVPPERRGRWGRFLRVKRGSRTQEDVRLTLEQLGRPLSAAYYSDFESGKTVPNDDWQAVFERMYGETPAEEPIPPSADPRNADFASLAAEQSVLIARQNDLLAAQAEVLERIAETLRVLVGPVEVQPQGESGIGRLVRDLVENAAQNAAHHLEAERDTASDRSESSPSAPGLPTPRVRSQRTREGSRR
jgi:uncharacterized coiled-coil protein SlyX